jgi:UDP-sulfoquinovose synthase
LKVLLLGGDGFCGWPTSLHLSQRGHDLLIVDNFCRRKIDVELEVESLTPIATLKERIESWKQLSGKSIEFLSLDVANEYARLLSTIVSFKPDAVIHFAEQKSAPYSMKSSWHKQFTIAHNSAAITNLLCALVDSGIDAHVIHLGTMGVYGYASDGVAIPEGYLTVQVKRIDGTLTQRDILHPTSPGSVYHLTKALDQLLLAYFNKNDGIRVTDLHQGIVWGTNTAETRLSEALINRFDYDGDFGTVLNRFLIEAANGLPITVHGLGGQTRAFINIQDTVRCIELALENPPQRNRVRILNQMTEVYKVIDLAQLVSKLTGASIAHVSNPRVEAENNDLVVENNSLLGFGLKPITLNNGLMEELLETAGKYSHRLKKEKIECKSKWRTDSPPEPAKRISTGT